MARRAPAARIRDGRLEASLTAATASLHGGAAETSVRRRLAGRSLGLNCLLVERGLHGVELVVLLLDLPLQRLDLSLILAQLTLSLQLLVEEGCSALLPSDRLGQLQSRQA